ncbi:helix-turn-helix domain-containing protein [Chitinophaga varians]|uniref:helix-turn-helix domain-containing protein n=1 Tax=Chitinophaga varians TaxID=2202339 RepID=UPI00165FCF05|nr:helix-turn-helix transcriptional regulator [Chitinophaga varians]
MNEKEVLKQLGIKLRRLRKAMGLSLRDIEARTGVPNTSLSKIERGLKDVEFLTICKLANGLETTISELTKDLDHGDV